MAVANLDLFDVRKTLKTALNVAALQSHIGNPIRMYEAMPRSVATFPFVLMTAVEAGPYGGVFAGPADWFRQETYRWTAFDNYRTLARVADIIKDIQDVMDAIAGTATTGGYIAHFTPGPSFVRWDPASGSPMGMTEYTLMFTR
jgi:hypothetical protein